MDAAGHYDDTYPKIGLTLLQFVHGLLDSGLKIVGGSGYVS